MYPLQSLQSSYTRSVASLNWGHVHAILFTNSPSPLFILWRNVQYGHDFVRKQNKNLWSFHINMLWILSTYSLRLGDSSMRCHLPTRSLFLFSYRVQEASSYIFVSITQVLMSFIIFAWVFCKIVRVFIITWLSTGDHAFCVIGTGQHAMPFLSNIGRAFACHTERRKANKL